MTTLYTVYHEDCGHVVGIQNDRVTCERIIGALAAVGQRTRGWQIRTGASDEDIASLLRGDCCAVCRSGGGS